MVKANIEQSLEGEVYNENLGNCSNFFGNDNSESFFSFDSYESFNSFKSCSSTFLRDKGANEGFLFWNIAGLRSKLDDLSILKFITSYSMFALVETWVPEGEQSAFEHYFREFNLYWVYAQRTETRGRFSGGFLLGFKKELQHISFNVIFGLVHFKLLSDQGTVIFLPFYLHHKNWEAQLDILDNFLNCKGHTKLIICGDFNAHIGCLNTEYGYDVQDQLKLSNRQSMDVKVDSRGRVLLELFNEYSIMILNGISKGDEQGQFTFHSQGLSVIDFACTNEFDLVKSVEVVPRCESDHSALKVTFNLRLEKAEEQIQKKIRWKTDKHFMSRFATYIETNLADINGSVNEQALRITSCIQTFPDAQHQPKIIYKKPWFDKDCSKQRSLALRSLRSYKKTMTSEDKDKYKIQQCKYISLKKEKKRLYYEGLYEQFGQVSSSQDFWNLVKTLKYKKKSQFPEVAGEELRLYFQKLLNPCSSCVEDFRIDGFKCSRDDLLDRNLDSMEFDQILKMVHNRKAPGIDRIPVEFFKNFPNMSILIKFYNKILQSGIVPNSFKKH